MSSKKKVPAIRFKGFGGDWDNEVLGANADFSKGQGYSKSDLVSEGSPIILYGRLYTQYQTVISEVDTFVVGTTKSIISKGNEVIVPASGETAEDISRASAVIKLGILLGGDLNIIYPNNKLNSIFLALTISNGKPQNDLSKRAQGKSVVHIRNNDLKEVDISYPDMTEQTKIGNYFQQLDTLIAQHQQKHDKLLNLKKALLEKMFPKQGATVPEIRFKGVSGEWEEKALGEDMDVTSVKRIHQSDWTTSGVRFLRARDIVSAYKNEEPSDYLYISKEKYTEYSLLSGKVQPGDLLVTGVGTIGIPMLITNDEPVYFKDGNIIWFKNENKIDGMFLFYSFVHDGIQYFIKSSAGTGTVGTYTIESGKKTLIKLPEKNEQTKIGNLFQQLDTLLTQHQAQLKKLNNIKQACLEKMFV